MTGRTRPVLLEAHPLGDLMSGLVSFLRRLPGDGRIGAFKIGAFKPSYPGCASELDSADLSFCPWSRSRTGAGGLMQHPAGTGHTV